jgi:chlorobactene lauroyltransferase
LFSGQATLLKLLKTAYFAPVAIRYDFLQEQKPESYISIGKPELLHWELKEKSSEWTSYFTEMLTHQMDMLTNDIHKQRLDSYTIWCKGPESIEKKWDSFRGIK